MAPLFEFNATLDSSITIGEKTLPLHIKRYSRAEVDAIEQLWTRLMIVPRGAAEVPPKSSDDDARLAFIAAESKRIEDWNESTKVDRLAFWEQTIRDAITLDEGFIVFRGKPITDGAGLIEVFYARKDVLRALVTEVYEQNHLVGLFRKNLNSLRDSNTGSASRIPPRSGDEQGPAVNDAEPSSSASDDGATAVDEPTDEGGPSPSGPSDAATKVH